MMNFEQEKRLYQAKKECVMTGHIKVKEEFSACLVYMHACEYVHIKLVAFENFCLNFSLMCIVKQ